VFMDPVDDLVVCLYEIRTVFLGSFYLEPPSS